MRNTARTGLVLAAGLLLTGCFDLDEEVWVHPDGSLKYRVQVSEPGLTLGSAGAKLITELRDKLEGARAVQHLSTRSFSREGRPCTELVAELSGAGALSAASAMGQQQLQVERDGDLLRVTRRIQGEPRRQGKPEDEALLHAMLSGFHYSFRLHAPRIEGANGELSEDHTTCTWRYSLLEVLDGVEMRAQLRVGPSAGQRALLKLGLLALILLGILVWRRRWALAGLVLVVGGCLCVARFGLWRGSCLALLATGCTLFGQGA